jgi:hypothetical protein
LRKNNIELYTYYEILVKCIKHDDLTRFKHTILKYSLNIDFDLSCLFLHVVKRNSFKIAVYLMDNKLVNIATRENKAIRIAAEEGYLNLMIKLDEQPETNILCVEQYALIWASTNGKEEIVDYLLLNPRTNPKAKNSEAIYKSLELNHISIFYKLINNTSKFNFHDRNNKLIKMAYLLKNNDLIRFIFNQKEVKEKLQNNDPYIYNAILNKLITKKIFNF